MKRKINPLLFVFVFVLSLVVSSGCRMCGSPLDACVPAHLRRDNDYRGCDPLYRAGSIFYGNADYSDTSGDLNCLDCSLTNTGMFGQTELIAKGKSPRSVRSMSPGTSSDEHKKGLNVPTIEDLLRGKPTEMPEGSVPESIPFDTPLPESLPPQPQTMPFSDNHSKVTGPKISVEDLRRLDPDPSITDIRILNIDDAVDKAFQ